MGVFTDFSFQSGMLAHIVRITMKLTDIQFSPISCITAFYFWIKKCSDFYVTHLYSLSVVKHFFVSGQMIAIFAHFCHRTSIIICALSRYHVWWIIGTMKDTL